MNLVIIKYNAGNIESVNNALMRLGVTAEITADHEKIRAADKVIFPGVGEASTTMAYLREHKLDELIRSLKATRFGHLPWATAHVRPQRRGRREVPRHFRRKGETLSTRTRTRIYNQSTAHGLEQHSQSEQCHSHT
jgi:hypothetical protein